MHRDDWRCRDLAVCTHLAAPCMDQVTGRCQRGLCCFIFTHIHSLFLSFPLLDLRLGWFRLLVMQMLELHLRVARGFGRMVFAIISFLS